MSAALCPSLTSFAMDLDDGLGDESDDDLQGPLLPPDDRLWRHPSEIAAHGLPGGRSFAGLRGRGRGRAERGRAVAWESFLSGATGALLVIGLVVAVGGFRTREVPVRSIERVAVSEREAVAPNVRIGDEIPGIVDRVSPTLVEVRAERPEGVLHGSGFVFRSDGYVLTSARVVQGATRVFVTLPDASRHLASIIGADPNTAVGVLKVDREGLTGAVLGAATALKPGQTAIALARPKWVTVGVVAAVGREVRSNDSPLLVDMIEVAGRFDPRASGGPLLDERGAVVGVTDVHGDRGYATPIDVARKVADELIHTGRVVYPWLGVEGEDVDMQAAAGLGLDGGALVTGVEPESPAYSVGLHPGDVIVALESVPIKTMAALKLELRNRRPGEAVTVEFYRGGRRMELNVTLVLYPNRL